MYSTVLFRFIPSTNTDVWPLLPQLLMKRKGFMILVSFLQKSPAYPDESSPFLDGDGVIVGHSIESSRISTRGTASPAILVPKLPQSPEVARRLLPGRRTQGGIVIRPRIERFSRRATRPDRSGLSREGRRLRFSHRDVDIESGSGCQSGRTLRAGQVRRPVPSGRRNGSISKRWTAYFLCSFWRRPISCHSPVRPVSLSSVLLPGRNFRR